MMIKKLIIISSFLISICYNPSRNGNNDPKLLQRGQNLLVKGTQHARGRGIAEQAEIRLAHSPCRWQDSLDKIVLHDFCCAHARLRETSVLDPSRQ